MRHFLSVFAAIATSSLLMLTPAQPLRAQSPQIAQKLEHLAKELKLTPEQKLNLMPILQEEAPQVKAIKADRSLTGPEKLSQLKSVHDQNDPKVRQILSPQQYQKLQEIRAKDIQKAVKKKMDNE